METLEDKIKKTVRNVKDFPRDGINFKDISTLLMNPELSRSILDKLESLYMASGITKVVGIESRGFVFGNALAIRLGVPFVMIRKEGKLPFDKVKQSYALEYGEAVIEMHKDAITKGDKVLIHDDLLATGGSAHAAALLIEGQGGEIVAFNFLIALSFLNGQDKIERFSENITNLASY